MRLYRDLNPDHDWDLPITAIITASSSCCSSTSFVF